MDVRKLRVEALVVVGMALAPGCTDVVVEAVVDGEAPVQLDPAHVRTDPVGHQLRLEGLQMSAIQSFRLAWRPLAAPPTITPSTSFPAS